MSAMHRRPQVQPVMREHSPRMIDLYNLISIKRFKTAPVTWEVLMEVVVQAVEDSVVVALKGILKKPDAMQVSEEILEAARAKPKRLALDCTELAALSFDSVPFIVSALERAQLGKKSIRAFGCNAVVERTLRGGDFERVGILG